MIFIREQSMAINDDAGGRAAADFVERGYGVGVVAGARPAALVPGHAPAVMPADGNVVQACRCVPRQKERPLGVTVIGKHVTTPVEVKIVRITKAACQRLKYFTVRRKANDCTTLCFLQRRLIGVELARPETGVVAADKVKPAIGTLPYGVRAVLAVGQAEVLSGRPVRAPIVVGVLVAEQGAVGHGPKIRPVEHHAHGTVIELGEEDGFVSAIVAVGVVQCADVAAARDNDSALGVERH